jgi:SseB protein N-terminal domain
VPTIPDPGFAGDTGEVDPDLAVALEAFDRSPGDTEAHRAVLNRLLGSRLLVPVVAILGEMEGDHEKTSDMAAVLMTGKDGRTALLAFTSSAALEAWNPEARPVPVTASQAALAALQEQASALLIDVAGPVMFVVEESELRVLGG